MHKIVYKKTNTKTSPLFRNDISFSNKYECHFFNRKLSFLENIAKIRKTFDLLIQKKIYDFNQVETKMS